MSFEVRFEAPAQDDLRTAFEWYEVRQTGLGTEFLRSVAAASELLARDPERHPFANAPYRSAKLRRFPYALHYRFDGQHVSILACLHYRQSPARWPRA
ncbi:type II toxin-antitoxin system RelE/ParE family toxin [Variovorax sp. Varisp41]|uniref:type II toxin-antitoxin system RelE/ParE family toxin n=1 Tax=unclassified Variovorax TaxID=663243 RepID=UPI000C4028BD|nr:type II toxin-antitoxin system RelE/ParE family toxin [Variovorax sp.]MBS77422.1 hypothetical protein [Variovorax sp.]